MTQRINPDTRPRNVTAKIIIPSAVMVFIAALFIFTIMSHGGSKRAEPTPQPTVPNENIGPLVTEVLTVITERPDYIYGDYEPLIGITDVNENGRAEILAVYETKNNGAYEVRYDVWRADSSGADKLDSDVLFTEADSNSGKLHMTRAFTENYYTYYVMLERNETMGEHFKNSYDFFEMSYDETALYYRETFVAEGHYDTEHGGIADADYYINTGKIPENPVSADNFNTLLNLYTTIYTLDIITSEYDWDNTISFDWAWKLFDQAG